MIDVGFGKIWVARHSPSLGLSPVFPSIHSGVFCSRVVWAGEKMDPQLIARVRRCANQTSELQWCHLLSLPFSGVPETREYKLALNQVSYNFSRKSQAN